MAISIHMKGSGDIDPHTLAKVQEGQTYNLLKFDEWSCMKKTPNDQNDPPSVKLFNGVATMKKEGGKRKRCYLARIKTGIETGEVGLGVYKAKKIDQYGTVLIKDR